MKFTAASGLRLIPDTAAAAAYWGKGIAYFGTNLSPALLGVGYIVGLNIGAVMLAGGIIAWNIAIPIYSVYFLDGNPELAQAVAGLPAADAAGAIRSDQIRYLGVGAMLIGGIYTLFSIRKSIVSGIRSGLAATRQTMDASVAQTERDLPMKYVLLGIVAFTLPLAALYYAIVDNLGVAISMTVIMILAGFVFCSVSAYMAGLVGSSNSPVSGITICTILFAALILTLMLGRNAASGPVATIMIGAVVCCAASIAGDNLQDLKAGHMIGASPWRQQVMLGVGAIASALVMPLVLNLLLKAYGMGPASAEHPQSLQAAQATLMESVSRGMFGGHLPWNMVMAGMGIGAVIIVIDEILEGRQDRRSCARAGGGGRYLPAAGARSADLPRRPACLHRRASSDRRYRSVQARRRKTSRQLTRRGMLFAAGLITGEALLGVLIAIPIVTSGRDDVFALPKSFQFGGWLGLLMLGALAFTMFRVGTTAGNGSAPEAQPLRR